MPEKNNCNTLKWWGWGPTSERFDLAAHPRFRRHLQRYLPLPEQPVLPVPALDDFVIPPSRLDAAAIAQLEKIVGAEHCRLSRLERLRHAVGKSYHDLIRLRRRQNLSFPDVVLYPQTETQIQSLYQWASASGTALIPFGGGTSVVGGVEALSGSFTTVATIDMANFAEIITLDEAALIVEAEAGIFGPDLESYLNGHGFTLGHSPESFQYSTLGGWIAARSSGQFSTHYGNIEDLVQSVRLITPRGALSTISVPASATGPQFKHLILGSEGVLGIISRARMHIRELPPQQLFRSYLFPDFATGVAAVYSLMHSGGKPTLLRLSDGTETGWALAMPKIPETGVRGAIAKLLEKQPEKRGLLPERRSLLLIGWEGRLKQIRQEKKFWERIRRRHHSMALGKWPTQIWYRRRYHNPYVRDELLDYGLLVDTLETAAEWPQIIPLYHAVSTAIKETLQQLGINGMVGAHLSHLYPQGSSLYFIIFAYPHPDKEVEQWWRIKTAASDAIVANGGTISHHHGVGLDHKQWYARQIDATTAGILRDLKTALDPVGILNPGKLLPDK